MYYRASRHKEYINEQLLKWLSEGQISAEMGRGFKTCEVLEPERAADDLRRGFDNFTRIRDGAEAPIPDGRGGYVPNGGTPMPPEGERSRLEAISYDGVYMREIRLMHELYGRINAFLLPIVKQVVNGMEYSGSDVYDYDLPAREGRNGGTIRDEEIDRDNLSRMVDEVYNRAVMMSDDINEIALDNNEMLAGDTREALLRAAIESLLLTEIFLSRRPFYRDTAEVYRFFDGRYDGIRPIV